MSPNRTPKTLGIIFMGGRARRLGGADKSAVMVGGQTCFDRVYRALSNGTDKIALSRPYGGHHPAALVIPDWPSAESQSSPALALLGCLSYAAKAGYDHILTSAVDTPFLPPGFAARLVSETLSSAAITGSQLHGLHGRWSCASLPALKMHILGGEHGISRLHGAMGSKKISFEIDKFDPFFNINRPEDLVKAQNLALKYDL